MSKTTTSSQTTLGTVGNGPRVLVAIASFGEKNLHFLKTIIEQYQSMPLSVDIVVLSEAPKRLSPGVTISVGLPSANPWSLPFAHKRLFADNVDRYDLFIYSEDDISITEDNIRAFLQATEVLTANEIAGFVRYEQDSAGALWIPDAHGPFHWDACSVVERGGYTFARYTNDHAAAYILTQDQLRRALGSGGFLCDPYEGKYDMLCSAATDPYTRCGLRRLVCISHLERCLLHHMSNRYTGTIGLPLVTFKQQIDILQEIHAGTHPATTLCVFESRMPRGEWSKSLYETPHDELLAMVPAEAKRILSVGCGWGATEALLSQRGAEVTVLPLNSVIGGVAAKSVLRCVYGELDQCLKALKGETYDCVLISNLLHLQREPGAIFRRCVGFVRRGGTLVVQSPNFHRGPTWMKRVLQVGTHAKLRSYEDSGISVFGPGMLVRLAKAAGFRTSVVSWHNPSLPPPADARPLHRLLGRLAAEDWSFRASGRC